MEKSGAKLSCTLNDTSWITLAGLNRATALFDQARDKVKGNSLLEQRVDIAGMPLEALWLEFLKKSDWENVSGSQGYRGPRDLGTAIDGFLKKAEKYGTRNYSENERFVNYKERLLLWRNFSGRKAPLPGNIAIFKNNVTHAVMPWDFQLFGVGKWAVLQEDGNAPMARAIKLPGQYKSWAIQYRFPGYLRGKWHLYLETRCDKLENYSETAMTCGIYDTESRRETLTVNVPYSKLQSDSYKLLYMGEGNINEYSLFFVQASGGEDGRTAPDVWVQRLILSRKKVPSSIAR